MSDRDAARILLISYAFPPVGLPEAYLAAKTLGNMHGIAVDVIASEVRGAQRIERSIFTWRDHSLDEYVRQRFARVIRVPEPRLVQALPVHRIPIVGGSPDVHRFSARRARRAAESLDLSRYSAVVTWSQWHSAHLVGLSLKRRNPQLRWIAHFSDPWVDNAYYPRGPIARFVNRRLERAVVSVADALAFTNEQTAQLMMKKYPGAWSAKATVIPHPFDTSLYHRETQARQTGTLSLRYVGQFYGRRTPEPLFAAISLVVQSDPSRLNSVVFELVGGVAPEYLDSAAYRSLPPGLVTTRPAVDYVTSLRLMSDADALLVIDAPGARSVFLPSKLVDYLGARRPIVGLTPPGTAAELLKELGYRSADPSDPAACASVLAETIRRLRGDSARADWGAEEVRARYAAPVVGESMRDLVFDKARL